MTPQWSPFILEGAGAGTNVSQPLRREGRPIHASSRLEGRRQPTVVQEKEPKKGRRREETRSPNSVDRRDAAQRADEGSWLGGPVDPTRAERYGRRGIRKWLGPLVGRMKYGSGSFID